MRRFPRFLWWVSLVVLSVVPAWCRDLTRYAVILTDPAAATVAARSDRAAMDSARTRIRSSHESIKAALRRSNIPITGEASTLLNAIFVAADASQLAQLRSLPGVAYIAKMPRYRLELDKAVQLINVPAAWSALGGASNSGAGIKIGIVDTGIETTHPAFQDPTLTPPSGFPKCDVPANCAFTNNKIIVARSYVSIVAAGSGSNPAVNSRPDDISARDRVGHGTAVAMAAAGLTSVGPSDTITGVAPKAFLGSYKVFGSPGVNDSASGDAIILALEDAFNDGMNIASLSLGGPAIFGPLDTGTVCGALRNTFCDPEVAAVQTAVNSGMVVVIAAGNAGITGSVLPTLGTISSPGDAPAAITVGATSNSHIFSNGLTVKGLGSYQSLFGTGPIPSTTLTGPLSDVANMGDPSGCGGVPANSLAGTIALVQRGSCTFATKVQNLQAAGAIGVIITNTAGDNTLLSAAGLNSTTIPATFVGYDDGQAIRAYLKTNPPATVSIDPNLAAFSVSTFDQMANFSSRGPTLGTAPGLKPDVAAVGTNLYLAGQNYDPNGELYSANGFLVSQGTSFSTPQIAGVAALVLQAHPTFTPAQVKSAVVNTASQSVTDGGAVASVLAVGAGKANAAAAIATNLTASPTSVSFGIVRSAGFPHNQTISLANTGSTTLTLTASLTLRTTETNAHVSVSTIAPIPAGQTGSVTLTLGGTLPAPGGYEGLLTIQGAASPLVIPFYYVVGDGVPYDIIPTAGNGDTGIAGQSNSEGVLVFQVLDRYGIPVSALPVQFAVTSGGGTLPQSDKSTDSYGFAGSLDTLGPTPGVNVFTATAGALATTFTITSTAQPTITPGGAVNAANDTLPQGFAPGSYVTLFGNNFGSVSSGFSTSYLPISIGNTGVSFDTVSLSVPGGLSYSSPTQINVQIPWEMQQALQSGQTSVQIKVDSGALSGAIYNLPLASYSPAFFEGPAGFVAALDQNNKVVTTSNAVGQGSVVQLFLNGLGPVSNQPASGMPASTSVLAGTTAIPVVVIGGQTVPAQNVQFSGLTPGSIGLYQVNVIVPDTGAGLQPITISIGGVTSSTSHVQVK
jgi:minor extracellular serine protease Vpr